MLIRSAGDLTRQSGSTAGALRVAPVDVIPLSVILDGKLRWVLINWIALRHLLRRPRLLETTLKQLNDVEHLR